MEGHRPSVNQQTRVLKLQPNCCAECVRKVKRAMLKVDGVHSIKVNANDGTIQVTSQVDPQVLIAMAAKACKRAQLLWEPQQQSSQYISPTTLPPVTTPSTEMARQGDQVQVSNFDQTVHLQDLVDKNAPVIKHIQIIDKRVTKITFKESNHDNPSGDHSHDTTSLIAPPSSESEAGGSGDFEMVSAPVAAATEPPSSIPHEINKPAEPPLANVNCSNGGNRCRVM